MVRFESWKACSGPGEKKGAGLGQVWVNQKMTQVSGGLARERVGVGSEEK